MRDIQDKTDGTGDILTAAAFNTNLVNELQRIPESADFTLDVEAGPDTDTSMFIKSLVIYVGASNYYDDTGAVNTFVLDRAGNLEPWPEYKDGMTVLFKALNTNTGACTINIDSLGAKSLTTSAGAALSSGDITTNDYVTARYDAGNDRFEMVVAPVTGGGGALSSWEENANDLRPITTKTGALGDSTHLIENLYIMDSGNIYLGDSQDIEITHDSGDGFFISNTGDLYIQNLAAAQLNLSTNNPPNGWYLDSSGNFIPDTTGAYTLGTTSLRVDKGWFDDLEITNTPTIGGADFITTVLPAQATHSGEYLQTDGAGTLSWAAISALSAWEENGNDLRPQTTNVSDIGDTTHLIVHSYHGTSGRAYFGASQQLSLYYDGAASYLASTSGAIYIDSPTALGITVNSASRWVFRNDGALEPAADNSYDLGDASFNIADIYQGDSGVHYFGSDQDMSIYHDGSNGYIDNGTGDINFVGCSLILDNNKGIVGKEIGGTTRNLIKVNSSDTAEVNGINLPLLLRSDGTVSIAASNVILDNNQKLQGYDTLAAVQNLIFIDSSDINQISNSAYPTNIKSDGTLTHNSVDMITSLLPAQATHSGEVLQTDGAGTLSWANVTGSLTSWEESGTVLRPTTSGYDLGDTTHLLGDAYFGDSGTIYLGTDQDMSIYHDGSNGYIDNNTGILNIPGAVEITNSTSPLTINRITSGTGCIYFEQAGVAGGLIGTDGTNMIFYNGTPALTLTLTDAGDLNVVGDIHLENNHLIQIEDSGTTARTVLAVDGSDICYLSNVAFTTNIRSNGTLQYNGTTLASGSIDTTSSQTITVVDGLITAIA